MEVTLFTPDTIPSDQPGWLPWLSKPFSFFLALTLRSSHRDPEDSNNNDSTIAGGKCVAFCQDNPGLACKHALIQH